MYGYGSGTKKTATGGGMSILGRIALALMRALLLCILSVLLLEPLIRNIQLDREEPVAILLIDESTSIGSTSDSAFILNQLRLLPNALTESLDELNIELETFGFSSQLNPHGIDSWESVQWNGQQTNLDAAVKELDARFENRNLAGFILASDGLINRGAQPEYSSNWPSTPLYTLGLGDTSIVKDLWIERVDHNNVAYLGNTFPVEAVIQSQGMENEVVTIEVHYQSNVIATQSWVPETNQASKKFDFSLSAEDTGIQRYEIRCNVQTEEANKKNNNFPFYLEVLKSKRQVLIVSDAPHPDVNAIALALKEQDQTQVTLVHTFNLKDASGLLGQIEKADVVIAHKSIGQFFGSMTWSRLMEINQKPCWWIVSDENSQGALAAIPDWGIRLDDFEGMVERHGVRASPNFKLFEVSDALESACMQWPPIQGPFGSLTWSAAWTPLFYRQLGNLETDQACWSIRENSSKNRMAVTVGEGFWNWRMRNYAQNENHQHFNELIQNHVQFLGSEIKKERLYVAAPKIIEVDQRFELTADVYDAALMPVSGVNIELLLKTEDGAEFNMVFLERNQRFALDAGLLQEGSYSWVASCQLDRELFEQSGIVQVQGHRAEQNSKPANHGLLLRLSDKTGGTYCGALDDKSAERVIEAMQENEMPATILHEQVKLNELIAWEYILWCLIAMLSIEWIVRRRSFGY